jgi:spore coat protein CotH
MTLRLILALALVLSACQEEGGGALSGAADAAAPAVDGVADVQGAEDQVAEPSAGTLVINEAVCRPTDGATDWVELLVTSETAVDLDGFTLVDDNDAHEPTSIGSGVLEPGAFLVVSVGEAEGDLPFGLGASDAVILARDGVTVDSLSWEDGDAPEGTSFGRLPDGAGEAQTLTPTPGAPNEAWAGAIPDGSPFVTDRVLAVEIVLSQEAWDAILADPQAETYQEANLVYDGEQLDQVAVRVKGNSSLNSVAKNPNSVRFSFKVDTNRYVAGQKLRGVKKLNLNNGFKDPSLLREHVGYKLAREMGLPAPRTAFADLTVAGIHLGLYTVVEHVDDDFVERWFANTTGDLYKPDWPDGHLVYQGDAFEDYGGLEIKTNEDTSDHAAFLHFVDVMNHGADEAIAGVFDVEMMLRYMALNTALVNLDSYTGNGHNYYCYEHDGVFTVIPWDLNEAFGNFNCGCDRAGIIGFMIDEPTCGKVTGKPLVARLLAMDEHRARYHELLGELVSGAFTAEVMGVWIDEAADLIRPTVETDTTKFYLTASFEKNLDSDVGGAIGLSTFVSERRAAIEEQLSGAAPSSASGAGSCGGGPGPGPGPGPRGNLKCPDEVCDGFEQSHCEVCPEDCTGHPIWIVNCL